MEIQDFGWPNVPNEVWELICDLCEEKILYTVLPLVSKLFRRILNDEGSFWKRRCARKNLDLSLKPENKSWKQYCRHSIRLFPFYGITLRQTTFAQLVTLKKTPPFILTDDKIKCAVLQNDIIVWCRGNENGKFNCVSTITGLKRPKPLPKAWLDQGINWSKSFNQYKELLANWNQNCSISTEPNIVDASRNIVSNISLMSVVKESDSVIYLITLDFVVEKANYDKPDTLFSIGLVATATVESLNDKAKLWHVNSLQ